MDFLYIKNLHFVVAFTVQVTVALISEKQSKLREDKDPSTMKLLWSHYKK